MNKVNRFFCKRLVFLPVLIAIQISLAFAQKSNITLNLDATEAARNILHVRETMAVKPGQFDLYFPKWIPGEHAPTGTLNDMVNLFITADGKPIEWRRDDVEMFAFHLTIPANARQIEISFDDVSQPETIASAALSRIKWNRLVLYPRGVNSDAVQVTASMKIPLNWQYATALQTTTEALNAAENPVRFKPVSLTRLIDSPAIIGKYFTRIPLINEGGAAHEIDAAADSAGALVYKPETLKGWNNLVKEANLMFGAHHYRNYKFLLTLSDIGGSEGLEHHESSEDGVGEKSFSDEYRLIDLGDLLGHEYAHSWNGKYRRPASLTTPDFEKPMQGELLWVYEGLTQYLGHVLPTRAGLWTPQIYREALANDAASLDNQTGRRWRPLVDTARAVQFTYGAPRAWRNVRRSVDYYDEGALVWLEADVLIRRKSDNKLSLNDFLKKFHGGANTAPKVEPYTFDEVVNTLNNVMPYDWRGFLTERIYKIQKNAPLGGITNGGWKLVYNETPNFYVQLGESIGGSTNLLYSIGASVRADGTISDINPDFAAYKSGLAPGMKITSVGGQAFTTDLLRLAVAATKTNPAPIIIEAENGGVKATYNLNYTGGLRYPHLERNASKPDTISQILMPLNKQGFVFSVNSRGSRRSAVPNKPADVINVLFSRTKVTANCAENSVVCSDGNGNILISTEAVDPENDVLTYTYVITGGKIIGTGAKVVWDLSGVKAGTYQITAAVDDGCGFCGNPMTKTIVIK